MFACRLAFFLLTLGISYQTEEEGEDPCKTRDYKVYPHSTLHKTVSDFTAWDRAKRSICDLHVNIHCFDKDLAEENKNCGDCDYDLDAGTWYRFSEPNDRIVVIETEGECPPQGHCNGYYALTLLRSNSTNFYFLVISGHVRKDVPSSCTAFPTIDKSHMVEMTECSDDVVLYRFPDSLGTCSRENVTNTCGSNSNETGILYTPASWCLTGTQAKPDSQKALLIGMSTGIAVLVIVLVALSLFVVHKLYTQKKPAYRRTGEDESAGVPLTPQSQEPDLPDADLPDADLPDADLPETRLQADDLNQQKQDQQLID